MAYHLGYIADQDLFNHVKATVEQYRSSIDLKRFHKNIIDPIKLSFDAKVYQKSWQQIVESEIIRQLDKSNNNQIGYFHQNIFTFIGDWEVPTQGFDIVHRQQKIFVEVKNKHNTMNSSSSQKTYLKMQNQLLDEPQSTCMLVEVIAKRSQNIPWVISLDGQRTYRDNVRRVSMDKFYAIATDDKQAFVKLCQVLPRVLDDVLSDLGSDSIVQDTVLKELSTGQNGDILKSIFKTSFATYEGFNQFEWQK